MIFGLLKSAYSYCFTATLQQNANDAQIRIPQQVVQDRIVEVEARLALVQQEAARLEQAEPPALPAALLPEPTPANEEVEEHKGAPYIQESSDSSLIFEKNRKCFDALTQEWEILKTFPQVQRSAFGQDMQILWDAINHGIHLPLDAALHQRNLAQYASELSLHHPEFILQIKNLIEGTWMASAFGSLKGANPPVPLPTPPGGAAPGYMDTLEKKGQKVQRFRSAATKYINNFNFSNKQMRGASAPEFREIYNNILQRMDTTAAKLAQSLNEMVSMERALAYHMVYPLITQDKIPQAYSFFRFEDVQPAIFHYPHNWQGLSKPTRDLFMRRAIETLKAIPDPDKSNAGMQTWFKELWRDLNPHCVYQYLDPSWKELTDLFRMLPMQFRHNFVQETIDAAKYRSIVFALSVEHKVHLLFLIDSFPSTDLQKERFFSSLLMIVAQKGEANKAINYCTYLLENQDHSNSILLQAKQYLMGATKVA